jgi:serine protease AprX
MIIRSLERAEQLRAITSKSRRNVDWGGGPAIVMLALLALFAPSVAGAQGFRKLDPELNRRASERRGQSEVVVRLAPGASLPSSLQRYVRGPRLNLIDGYVLSVPDAVLPTLDTLPEIASAHQDRTAWAADFLSTRSTGAAAVQKYGGTGRGVGVAVLDSGITTWHDDLTADGVLKRYSYGNQRVSKFVDFVNGRLLPYDDHGHGSHVAGIVLGNGYDSNGRHVGMAPEASLIALKVLDAQGKGNISTIIKALDWVEANAASYNIRIVNLSLGAAVTQSYWTDPLTLAVRRLTERGIVVVAAAGNLGRNAQGQQQYGGIIAPGNAPWVLTVGASSTEGTVVTHDDVVTGYSSLGPTRGDYLAKPDLVAPGQGVLSLSVPGSTLYQADQAFLVSGSSKTGYPPYLSLSGTSMATPQVSGAVALMLQANPLLTPNLVKAILQYTARREPEYPVLQQGAGFLNVLGAVSLSRFYFENRAGSTMPVEAGWSRHIVWGNHEISGGYLNPLANAWATNIVWGQTLVKADASAVASAASVDNIVWGVLCGGDNCSNIVWGVADVTGSNIVWGVADNIVWGVTTADNIVWGVSGPENIVWGVSGGETENIVWGVACGGDNCANIVWGVQTADNIVWGVVDPNANIVWGVADNIVWGVLNDNGNIVWGVADANNNIVWGVADNGNIVWGVADNIVWGVSADNIVWGVASLADNIVWGVADNIVWGVADNIVWGVNDVDNVLWDNGVKAQGAR